MIFFFQLAYTMGPLVERNPCRCLLRSWKYGPRNFRDESTYQAYQVRSTNPGTKRQIYFALKRNFSDNTDGLYKLANLHYQLGEAEPSLNEIRECLRLDPEHKHCYPLYKKLKKVARFLTDAQVIIFL